jgi:polyphenol oxidase
MFFSKKLKKFKNIKHCFFSRKNGFSKGCYESLNCGLGSNDNKETILKNLKFVSSKIGCKNENLITLNQQHSTNVLCFKNKLLIKNKLSGDAIVSEVKNIGIGILSADCAPIFFYDPKKKIIAAAHSGWKGALNGIIENTLIKFNESNSKNTDLIAVVGPCINKKNYEVKKDFMEIFLLKNNYNKKFFENINNDKYLFDLRGYINNELHNFKVENIENIEMDTYEKKDFFYSYRRSCHEKEKDYGRCISVILMT